MYIIAVNLPLFRNIIMRVNIVYFYKGKCPSLPGSADKSILSKDMLSILIYNVQFSTKLSLKKEISYWCPNFNYLLVNSFSAWSF